MLAKQKPTASTMGQENNLPNELYLNTVHASSAKLEQIVNLLLTLAVGDLSEAKRLAGWSLFGQQLSAFYGGGKP